MCSFGMSGKVFHGPLLSSHNGFDLCTILERHKDDSRNEYSETQLVRSYDEILNDTDIELVVVNTPDHLHYEMVKQALNAGKHVVVEKPFTLHYVDARELIKMAKDKNLLLSVFQNRRWDGDFLTVKSIIDQKKLGRLVYFEAHFDRFRNFIQDQTWKEDDSLGTGTLYNLGSHLIDQALVLFGKPETVIADIRTMRTGGKIDDMFEIWMQYPNVKVTVTASYLVKEPGPRYLVHGTHGSFLKWGIDPQEEALKEGEQPTGKDWGADNPELFGVLNTIEGGTETKVKYPTLNGNYMGYYDDIYQSIREKKTPTVTAEDAALVVRVIEAAIESSKKGTRIAI